MNTTAKSNSLQSYQVILYGRALHPELFSLKGRQVLRNGDYEVESWTMNGSHLLRFEYKTVCCCELVTDNEKNPTQGVVSSFLCAGEHEFEHRFPKDRVNYMTSVQTETLSENLFATEFEELLDLGKKMNALIHRWNDDVGPCLSVLAMQALNREAHIQAYHLLANGGLILRSQTIFEHA